MAPFRPKTRSEHRPNAPKRAPCPHCGTPGRRQQKLTRTVRSLAYQTILLIRVTTAEYRPPAAAAPPSAPRSRGSSPRPSIPIPSASRSSTACWRTT